MQTVVREAGYWARQDGATTVRCEYVRKAVEEQAYRYGLVGESLQEMIANGTLLVDTSGAVVGQVNGLGVYSYTDYRLAEPDHGDSWYRPGRGRRCRAGSEPRRPD